MDILPFVLLGLFAGVLLLCLGALVAVAILPIFGKQLLHEPGNSEKIAIFTAPEPGRSSIIMRGGAFEHVVHGIDAGEQVGDGETFANPIFKSYDGYARLFGLRFVGIPGIHDVWDYDLPRRRMEEDKDGRPVYLPVPKDDPSRRSNHFRTQITPWYNEFPGVDIEGLPFDVKCATNYRIVRDKVREVAFGVDGWHTLLDQALYGVARGSIRELVTVEDAIGGISRDIWDEGKGNPTKPDWEWQQTILERLLTYKLKNGKTLHEMGIELLSFEVLDFQPKELAVEELVQLRAPALARRKAQARSMEALAEADYQEKMLAVLAKHPDLAKANVSAEAFVKAAKAGTIDALLAALLSKMTK